MSTPIYTVLAVLVVLTTTMGMIHVAKAQASAMILLYLAESLLITNIHPSRRPDYIIKKCNRDKAAFHWLVRPLAVWYINNRGVRVATIYLRLIREDLKSDENIELMEE